MITSIDLSSFISKSPKPQSCTYNKVNEFIDFIINNIPCDGFYLEKRIIFNVDESIATTPMTTEEVQSGSSFNDLVNIPYIFSISFEKNLINTKDEFMINEISYLKNATISGETINNAIYIANDKVLIYVLAI